MSPNSRICTQCGWEDRAFKSQRERPAPQAPAQPAATPPPAPIGFACPVCHATSGISAGRCINCGNLIESPNYGHQGAVSFEFASPVAQEQFRVRQQHPGTHDAKLTYACPRCTAKLDPSSGRCPNCGYMGSMEYDIPQSQTVAHPPPPPPPRQAPIPPPTQHTVPAQHYHRSDSSSSQTCPSCQATISSDSRICPYCGGQCGPGRKTFSALGKKTTLERAYESAASASYQPYAPPPPPPSAAYYPEAEPFPGMAGRIPVEDRMQPREKKRKKRKEKEPKEFKELSETPTRRKFPIGLLVAVIIVAVALIGMVIFVIAQELGSPSPTTGGPPALTEDDTIAPIISDIEVTDIKSTSAVISWSTDERATSEVQLCDDGDSCIFADDDSLVRDHSLQVPNLSPGMEYHVTIRCTDEDGNTEEIEWGETFTTSGGAASEQSLPVGITAGDLAPDFTLQDIDGVSRALSDYRGDIVLLNFWQTTCAPCMEELPFIEEVYAGWDEDVDLVVLAVNSGEPASNFVDVIEPYGFTFTVLEDRYEEVTEMYNINVYPTTYFIDPEGVIRGVRQDSFETVSELEDALDSYNW